MRTLKEIAIELLERYENAERACIIYEQSSDFTTSLKNLAKEKASYLDEIEKASK